MIDIEIYAGLANNSDLMIRLNNFSAYINSKEELYDQIDKLVVEELCETFSEDIILDIIFKSFVDLKVFKYTVKH